MQARCLSVSLQNTVVIFFANSSLRNLCTVDSLTGVSLDVLSSAVKSRAVLNPSRLLVTAKNFSSCSDVFLGAPEQGRSSYEPVSRYRNGLGNSADG